MYVLTAKKAVHKPFEATYFMSRSLSVASWFLGKNFYLRGELERNLYAVRDNWELVPVEPNHWVNSVVSPEFVVSPVTVYGNGGSFRYNDGTVNYHWFTPVGFNLSPTVNAKTVLFLNTWYSHHLFKNWEFLSVQPENK